MPHGKGTYGSKVGRPAKKSPMNKNGDPKKKKEAGKFQSKEQAIKNIKAFGKGDAGGYKGGGAILSPGRKAKPQRAGETQKLSDQTPEQRDAMRKRMREGATYKMPKGPRSEGKRGKGTGFAN